MEVEKKAQDYPGDMSNLGSQEDEENLAKKTEILGELREHGFLINKMFQEGCDDLCQMRGRDSDRGSAAEREGETRIREDDPEGCSGNKR